ncbi:MAG: hypothetical protein J7642_22035 [Cyanobacteria bacterium SBC]|nr:hypothetical protein [Cyanobacteria bacterium SBC]
MRILHRSRYVRWNRFDRTLRGWETIDFVWRSGDGRVHRFHRRDRFAPQTIVDRYWLDEYPTSSHVPRAARVSLFPFDNNDISPHARHDADVNVVDTHVVDVKVAKPQKNWKDVWCDTVTAVRKRLKQTWKSFRNL